MKRKEKIVTPFKKPIEYRDKQFCECTTSARLVSLTKQGKSCTERLKLAYILISRLDKNILLNSSVLLLPCSSKIS
ncbi:hypothetical protein T07_6806 [Trichinella nelsoni]|uniref:Uncharacterized protein n=1 Tax=Trichinella nelsoni TaxID=6336 RepID=A0A0V0RG43_9BILA|nr:hypothetical protein T07_6806 [Trichinella nelsoni]